MSLLQSSTFGGVPAEIEAAPFISKDGLIVLDHPDRRRWKPTCLSMLVNLLFAFIGIWLGRAMSSTTPAFADEVYSPVQNIVSRQNVVFTSGFGDGRTAYMGPPSPDREALWNDLYGFGTSMINRDQASRLVNKTVPVPDKDGQYDGTYVIMLGVFHQLHCVNLLRKSLYQDRPWSTDADDPMSLMHLEHCVDALRQAVMCSVDITPHPWVWEQGQNREVATVMHTCRNFDAIREWARDRDVFEYGWDKSIHVPDPLSPQ